MTTKTASRVFWMLVWLGALVIAGTVILTLAASRVGEHKSSTYGRAYTQFQRSWGGEIGIVPPTFLLERTYTVREFNDTSKQYEVNEKTERIPLIPTSIDIDSVVDYGEQRQALLSFNTFEAKNTETYMVSNGTGYSGRLLVGLTKPDNANLMYDYKVVLPEKGDTTVLPIMTEPFIVLPEMAVGESTVVIITYTTKGMDILKYNLSAYQNTVIDGLKARIALNTRDFEIYRFGLPHEIEETPTGANIRFEIDDFSTTQDLGITFDSKAMYLDQIQSLISYSPVALALYLLVIFSFSQILAVHFNPLHYLFIVLLNAFYFLFVSYLIRFFGLAVTFGASTALTAAMFLLYCPNVLGKRFTVRIAGPYLFLLTVVFSLIFMMPLFRGLLFVTLVFLVFLSIMISLSRSDISKWQIVTGEVQRTENA